MMKKHRYIFTVFVTLLSIALILFFMAALMSSKTEAQPILIPLSDLRLAHNAATMKVGPDICFSENSDHAYSVPKSLNFGLYVGKAPDPYKVVLSQIGSNYRGSTGSAGDLWLGIYDGTPQPANQSMYHLVIRGSGSPCYPLGAHGPGFVALYNEGKGKFLHLWAEEAGNSDAYALRLCTWKPSGIPIPCKTLSIKYLSQTIDPACFLARNVAPYPGWATWHEVPKWTQSQMVLSVNGDQFTVDGTLTPYTNPNDPSSPLRSTACGTIHYSGSLKALGLSQTGNIGFAGAAVNSFVSSSMTKFSVELQPTQP